MEYIVRLESINLQNFKNVENGSISLIKVSNALNTLRNLSEDTLVSDLIGIYGQNGSGKSAVVDSLYILKKLLLGESLEDECINYIRTGSNELKCSFDFFLVPKNDYSPKLLVSYAFVLLLVGQDNFIIKSETLKYKSIDKDDVVTSGKIIEYDIDDKNYTSSFMTQENMRLLRAHSKDAYKKLEAYLISKKSPKASFIFNTENLDIFTNAFLNDKEIFESLHNLSIFAKAYLFIYRNDFSGKIMENKIFPLSYSKGLADFRYLAQFVYRYNTSPIEILDEDVKTLQNIMKNLNIVLNTIISGMTLELEDCEIDYTIDGKKTRRLVLFSNRDGNRIPFKYESDGIKKIVSILGIIIDMYNNPSVTLVVDELDSGIFEYLLGELLKILEDNGLGQLYFTSHNLRPLELLDYKSLFFTTVNPKNRYTKLTDIKTNNNVRDVYYTSIQVGTKEDDLYEMVDSFTIKNALFEAGFNLEE